MTHLAKTFQMLIARKSYSIIINKRKHAQKICELCVENVRKKETFDVMINVKPCTMLRQDHFVYLANHVKFVYEKKLCLCVRHLWFLKKLIC